MYLKTPCQILLIVAFLTVFARSDCYNYWKGNPNPNINASSYCQSLIIWPVSDLVLNDSYIRDSNAMSYYQEIYNTSYASGGVTVDCLGMLQYMACALTYPTCANGNDSIETVCNWLCELMAIRCGTDTQLYIDACVTGKVATTNCSFGEGLLWTVFLLISFVALI